MLRQVSYISHGFAVLSFCCLVAFTSFFLLRFLPCFRNKYVEISSVLERNEIGGGRLYADEKGARDGAGVKKHFVVGTFLYELVSL